MLALISPAKKLHGSSTNTDHTFTQPLFSNHTLELTKILQKLSTPQLKDLMKLSDKLADLNVGRFKIFSKKPTEENARQAIFLFAGDTYQGLKAETFGEKNLDFAQEHLLILSGLYGLLRPLDLIQPHRLEMGTKLQTPRGKSLYDFWGSSLINFCIEHVKAHKNPSLIFLGSNEYIKALGPLKEMSIPSITCHFKECRNSELKTIGLFAKKARGMMARFMIQNRLESPEDLKGFREEGYAFRSDLSTETDFIFARSS
ncbi:MAG: peroxide stress protein YaaA [Verrucomicrobiaceae bacterium]|nr:peroxide stress protein YaaA [Verrucomicrobiaceae bacterium]